MPAPDVRLHFPATLRNRQPILDVLAHFLPPRGLVLEVGSGSGEHAMFFAAHLPKLDWRPSDPEPDHRASIAAYAAEAGLDNLLSPLDLDVTSAIWPLEQADAVLSINLLHIAPWECCEGLMAGAGRVLPPAGRLVLYGPFKRDGRHTAPSNAAFDRSLRHQDSSWGVRDLDDVAAVALRHGLALEEEAQMLANNLSLIFEKT